jgi:hypothetical protein
MIRVRCLCPSSVTRGIRSSDAAPTAREGSIILDIEQVAAAVCWQSARVLGSVGLMSDRLYDRDILSWSEHQADLLRRIARGERVNDVDWEHVVEEIEDVGLSELHAVESYLDLILVHLLKLRGWPDSPSVQHWRMEIGSFQKNASRRFSPSMRQRLDLTKLYSDALEQLEGIEYDGIAPRVWPVLCPFTLDDLLNERRTILEERLNASGEAS